MTVKETARQAAFFTRPERMQDVQTRSCFRAPFTSARTLRRFGFHRRRRALLEWLMTFPYAGPLPQSSHFCAIVVPIPIPIPIPISRVLRWVILTEECPIPIAIFAVG
jgi:hypothetical protein